MHRISTPELHRSSFHKAMVDQGQGKNQRLPHSTNHSPNRLIKEQSEMSGPKNQDHQNNTTRLSIPRKSISKRNSIFGNQLALSNGSFKLNKDSSGKQAELISSIKKTYQRILTYSIGRELTPNEEELANEMDISGDPITYQDKMYGFMKNCVDNLEEKKVKTIIAEFVEDYDKINRIENQFKANLASKNVNQHKSVHQLNNILKEQNQTAKQTNERFETSIRALKERTFYLIDDIEKKNCSIIQQQAENEKKEFAITTMMENQMANSILEDRLRVMGNLFFNQMSYQMKHYTEVIGMLDNRTKTCSNAWQDCKLVPSHVDKHNQEFTQFFKASRDMIDKYEKIIKKVDFNSIKNIVKDYKIKKANLEREIDKKRHTTYTGIDYKCQKDLQDTKMTSNYIKNPDYKEADELGSTSKRKIIDTFFGYGIDKEKNKGDPKVFVESEYALQRRMKRMSLVEKSSFNPNPNNSLSKTKREELFKNKSILGMEIQKENGHYIPKVPQNNLKLSTQLPKTNLLENRSLLKNVANSTANNNSATRNNYLKESKNQKTNSIGGQENVEDNQNFIAEKKQARNASSLSNYKESDEYGLVNDFGQEKNLETTGLIDNSSYREVAQAKLYKKMRASRKSQVENVGVSNRGSVKGLHSL